jgi:hypothetical protein
MVVADGYGQSVKAFQVGRPGQEHRQAKPLRPRIGGLAGDPETRSQLGVTPL